MQPFGNETGKSTLHYGAFTDLSIQYIKQRIEILHCFHGGQSRVLSAVPNKLLVFFIHPSHNIRRRQKLTAKLVVPWAFYVIVK